MLDMRIEELRARAWLAELQQQGLDLVLERGHGRGLSPSRRAIAVRGNQLAVELARNNLAVIASHNVRAAKGSSAYFASREQAMQRR